MTDDFIVGITLGLGVGTFMIGAICSSPKTVSDLEKDPEKLEQFYQETKAAQIKAAAEKANAAAEKAKATAEELKRVQGPVKITSATTPHKYARFELQRA